MSIYKALAIIWQERPVVVILPDPELFVLGSLIARLRGVRPVIDIHENYAKATASRDWIPTWLKPPVRLTAHANDRIGRIVASATIVAAEELLTAGATLIPNIPDPGTLIPGPSESPEPTVVYIGDVTKARGAYELADLAKRLPTVRFLVIGRLDGELKETMYQRAGPDSKLELRGQLPHAEAWTLARGSIAGLSLLHDLPAYVDAIATKLWEYCASGIPPVVTDLAGQRRFVEKIDPGLAGGSVDEIQGIIEHLGVDTSWRAAVSKRAREVVEDAWERNRPDLALSRAIQP